MGLFFEKKRENDARIDERKYKVPRKIQRSPIKHGSTYSCRWGKQEYSLLLERDLFDFVIRAAWCLIDFFRRSLFSFQSREMRANPSREKEESRFEAECRSTFADSRSKGVESQRMRHCAPRRHPEPTMSLVTVTQSAAYAVERRVYSGCLSLRARDMRKRAWAKRARVVRNRPRRWFLIFSPVRNHD